ncbi:MAG: TlpA family protein disulfide reductase [Hyphomicrobium sp.]
MGDDAMRGKGLMIAAAAALVGFGAIYLTMGRSGNEKPAAPTPAADAGAGPAVGGGAASGFKLGQLAAFVTKKSPEPLPNIAFQDSAGAPRTLADFKGRTILLNLWATWCAPCRKEMPGLDRLQQALGGDKFEVVALSLDRQGADASQKFLNDVGAKALKLYIDPTAKQGTVLKILGMPTTILIDAEGREIGRLSGEAEWDSDDAKKLIEAAIGGAASQ